MNISKILQSNLDIFTINDLKKVLDTNNENTIRNYLSRAKNKGLVENIYYGIWKLVGRNIDIFQIATKIKKKSYISFETALKQKGVIFQHYGNTIFLASDNKGQKVYQNWTIEYFKIKDDILLNPLGIKNNGKYSVAGIERAICDTVYRSPNYFFDDISFVDFDLLQEISHIYNKRVILEIKKLTKNA